MIIPKIDCPKTVTHRELCELFGEKPKDGKGRYHQLDCFRKYYKIEWLKRNTYAILCRLSSAEEKAQAKESDYRYWLLQNLIAMQEHQITDYTINELKETVGLVNHLYRQMRHKLKKGIFYDDKLSFYDYKLKNKLIELWFNLFDNRDNSAIEYSLDNMVEDKIITYEKHIKFYVDYDKSKEDSKPIHPKVLTAEEEKDMRRAIAETFLKKHINRLDIEKAVEDKKYYTDSVKKLYENKLIDKYYNVITSYVKTQGFDFWGTIYRIKREHEIEQIENVDKKIFNQMHIEKLYQSYEDEKNKLIYIPKPIFDLGIDKWIKLH